jgi:hypothetical protein
MGRKPHHPSLDAFIGSVLSTLSQLEENGRFSYLGRDMEGKEVTLSLYLKGDRLPEVNDIPVNLQPERIYDSPYLWSEHGSGIIHLQKGEEKLILDFN